MAERGGFEPPVGYKPTHAFQACALNHSAISPAHSFNCEEAVERTQYFSARNSLLMMECIRPQGAKMLSRRLGMDELEEFLPARYGGRY